MRALLVLALLVACDDRPVVGDPPPRTAPTTREGQGTGVEEATKAPPIPDPQPEPVAPPDVIAIDTHVDTPQRMLDDGDDIAERLPGGHLDIPRMREGGLDGAFFSIWVSPRRFQGEAAWRRALGLVRSVREVAEEHPDLAVICTTAEEVRAAAAAGKIALLMGVEGAHALGTDDPDRTIERLRELHRLGARYMTITWSNDNPLGHSSTGEHPELGLTDLGRRVVEEMNRLGMIVDVSHVSDQTFLDIMEVTRRPVLASHSSARALADHPRNMTDDMIRRVAAGGGAVCVNYFSDYVDTAYRRRRDRLERAHRAEFDALEQAHGDDWIARGTAQLELARRLDPDIRPPDVTTVGAHFEHIVRLGGMNAACLGSDFDGVSELPIGLEDVSKLPALRAELERRRLDFTVIAGENVLRVLAAQIREPR